MSYVCDRMGLESIMDGFDLHEFSSFSVWQGKTLKFQYQGDDLQEAREFFENNLAGLHPNSTALYEVRFYKVIPEKGITNASPYSGSFTFKMRSSEDYSGPQRGVQVMGADNAIVKLYKEENAKLEARLAEMEQRLAERVAMGGIDDDHEPDTLERVMGFVENNPKIQDFFMGALNKLMDGLFGSAQANNQHQIAGIEIDQSLRGDDKIQAVLAALVQGKDKQDQINNLESLSEALRLLLLKDADLLNTLVKLSRMPESKYNMAKTML